MKNRKSRQRASECVRCGCSIAALNASRMVSQRRCIACERIERRARASSRAGRPPLPLSVTRFRRAQPDLFTPTLEALERHWSLPYSQWTPAHHAIHSTWLRQLAGVPDMPKVAA